MRPPVPLADAEEGEKESGPHNGTTMLQINTFKLTATIRSRVNKLLQVQDSLAHMDNAQSKGRGERRVT